MGASPCCAAKSEPCELVEEESVLSGKWPVLSGIGKRELDLSSHEAVQLDDGSWLVKSSDPAKIAKASNGIRSRQVTPEKAMHIPVASLGCAADAPCTVIQKVRMCVAAKPDEAMQRQEVDGKCVTTSWKEFLQEASVVARALMTLGVQQQTSVSTMGNTATWMYATSLGTVMIGARNAGIYNWEPSDVCANCCRAFDTSVVIVDTDEFLERFVDVLDQLDMVKTFVIHSTAASVPQPRIRSLLSWQEFTSRASQVSDTNLHVTMETVEPGHVGYLTLTSGTTGDPKIICLSHDNLLQGGASWAEFEQAGWASLGDEQGVVQSIGYFPMAHCAAVLFDFFLPMARLHKYQIRSMVTLAKPHFLNDKEYRLKILKDVRPTVFFAPAKIWEDLKATISKLNPENGCQDFSQFCVAVGLDRCKVFLAGSSIISASTVEWYETVKIRLLEGVSSSETSGAGTRASEILQAPGCYGFPLPGVEMKIVHIAGFDGPFEGEVCFRSRGNTVGYLGDVERTLDAFDEDGFLHTGDLVRIDSTGCVIKFLGRKQDLIITSSGKYCWAPYAEDAIKKAIPFIGHCMVVGHGKPFMSVLLTLEHDEEGHLLCQEELASTVLGCTSNSLEEANHSDVLQSYVNDRLRMVQAAVPSNETWSFRTYRFVEPFSESNLCLTRRKGSLRRFFVLEMYEDLLQEIYSQDEGSPIRRYTSAASCCTNHTKVTSAKSKRLISSKTLAEIE